MTSQKFPTRKPNGSFEVEVGLRVTGSVANIALRAQAWADDTWMPEHTTWAREWRTGPNLETVRTEQLHYNDEFASGPDFKVGPDSELQLRLRGKKGAKFWKDWLVSRLIPDLKAAFPEVGDFLYIRDRAE